MNRPPMDQIIKANEALSDAAKAAFAETRHIHRLEPQIAEMVVAEVAHTMVKPEYHWAFKVLGDHFADMAQPPRGAHDRVSKAVTGLEHSVRATLASLSSQTDRLEISDSAVREFLVGQIVDGLMNPEFHWAFQTIGERTPYKTPESGLPGGLTLLYPTINYL